MEKESFEALASKPRLSILEALREKDLECTDPEDCDLSNRCCNVGELAEELELSQPTVSHHLKELRRAGFIETEKEGRTLYCSLNKDQFEALAEFLQSFSSNGSDATCG